MVVPAGALRVCHKFSSGEILYIGIFRSRKGLLVAGHRWLYSHNFHMLIQELWTRIVVFSAFSIIVCSNTKWKAPRLCSEVLIFL